ncbi:UDP-2,4-diacetamido-2,4,6-trideoxy-beta-L-altropyranose hydrolase [Viridibacillus arvi]|uniref:UDP-2,4-diacetamido-2,4, 6-trideoxy-beta-L-altropyranose hydrolase n=1 Tax=Viridibacillus arvi TaxID=263475 RepID=UPI003CFD2E10
MNIVFRADASNLIGSGHIMRCLTLASELKKHNHEISFICKKMEGDLVDLIKDNNFIGYSISNSKWEEDAIETINILEKINPDLLIIDHYSIDIKWEKKVSSFVSKILVIDDLANRQHHCDYLLDQNYYVQENERYKNLLNENTIQLIGAEYALLRNEFTENKKGLFKKNIKNFFVYFGAADISNETQKVLSALIEISKGFEITIDVVIGYSNNNKDELYGICTKYPFINIHKQTNEISKLMVKSDISIGAGGSTTWERCCIGLPSIVIPVASNQVLPMEELSKAKAIILIKDPSIDDYKQVILKTLKMTLSEINQLIQNGFQIFDGLGVKRVTKIIEEMK